MKHIQPLPYTITHLIVDYIIKFELANQKISSYMIPATQKNDFIQKVKAEELDHLSQLINDPIGYDKAVQVQKGRIQTRLKKFRIYNNYRSVQDFVNNYDSHSFLKPSLQLMIHINKLLFKGITEDWEAGKLRNFSEQPNEIYDLWYGARDYYPNINYQGYFNSLIDSILKPTQKVHPLISISQLIFELIDKAPFHCGNQITTLLFVSLLLKERNYNKDNVFSAVNAINFISHDLISAFRISKSARDMTTFIEAVCYALSFENLSLQNRYSNVYNNDVKRASKLSDKLNQRQLKLLDYLEHVTRINRKEYARMMGISFMTAYRDLQELTDASFIASKGVGRGTYYELISIEIDEKKKSEGLQVFSDL